MYVFIFRFFFLLLLASFDGGAVTARDNATDLPALLSIKEHLRPSSSLSSWDVVGGNQSADFCRWLGATCGTHPPGRVTALDLDDLGLEGSISPAIGSLAFLRLLNFSLNSLQGPVPPDIGRLSFLHSLDLQENSLEGTIPATLANCSNLRHLTLSQNRLGGAIPPELASLRRLETLRLEKNNLNGEIPAALGNASSLMEIALQKT